VCALMLWSYACVVCACVDMTVCFARASVYVCVWVSVSVCVGGGAVLLCCVHLRMLFCVCLWERERDDTKLLSMLMILVLHAFGVHFPRQRGLSCQGLPFCFHHPRYPPVRVIVVVLRGVCLLLLGLIFAPPHHAVL
jgi:hypothetical protein